MGKYAHLQGQIPKEPEPTRDAAFAAEFGPRADRPMSELVKEFNDLKVRSEQEAATLAKSTLKLKVLDVLIRRRLDADGLESVKAEGFNWTKSPEPYPVVLAGDVEQIMEYFRTTPGMETHLKLKATEVASRLTAHVKQEAMNNELVVEETQDEEGNTHRVVKSTIPGVTVFLSESLSRTKVGQPKRRSADGEASNQ